jgi:hypothetical protein
LYHRKLVSILIAFGEEFTFGSAVVWIYMWRTCSRNIQGSFGTWNGGRGSKLEVAPMCRP